MATYSETSVKFKKMITVVKSKNCKLITFFYKCDFTFYGSGGKEFSFYYFYIAP